MMRRLPVLLLAAGFTLTINAQEYMVRSPATDSFSAALVRIINAAPSRFETLKGDSIRSTWLLGTDYKMVPGFPGTAISVVRYRDWDKNAYVEFRGYKDEKEQLKGMKMLIMLIKNTLGDRGFYTSTKGQEKFAMISLQDSLGYFSPNIELMCGSSTGDSYLLGPEQEEKSEEAKKFFILMKVSGGIPNYQFYIPANVISPEPQLTITIQQLMKFAVTDFDSIPRITNPSTGKLRRSDTIQKNGYAVHMFYRSANYSATIMLPINQSEKPTQQQWKHIQEAVQAAVGKEYVYSNYDIDGKKSISFYASPGGKDKPQVRLSMDATASQLNLSIQSSIVHATNRGLTKDDFD